LGVITQRTCRHYIGADADKASIPASAKTAGDIFEATDNGYFYVWNDVAWAWTVPDASIVESKLGPLACAEGKIGNLAISKEKIQTDAVETVKIKDLNVTKAKAELGFGRYVPRAVATHDWGLGDFTVDGALHADGLDCSAIVPVGAIAIHFLVYCRDDAAGSEVALYANQTTKALNYIDARAPVANISVYEHGVIYCDSNRLIDYLITNGMDVLGVSVLGYYI